MGEMKVTDSTKLPSINTGKYSIVYRKDSLTAEDVLNEYLSSRAFFVLGDCLQFYTALFCAPGEFCKEVLQNEYYQISYSGYYFSSFYHTHFFSPGPAIPGRKIGCRIKYEGQVRLRHEEEWKDVKKWGSSIRNSAVFNDDTVLTMHSSMADLVFNDNTQLEVKEDTSLTVCTREITEGDRTQEGLFRNVAGTHRNMVRTVHLKAGKIWAKITPSKSVLTEFETPTGVATVKGTVLPNISYLNGVFGLSCSEGAVGFNSSGNEVMFDIDPGDALNVSSPDQGGVSVGVLSGQIDVRMHTGTAIVDAHETVGVKVDEQGGDTITAQEGTIAVDTAAGTATLEENVVVTASVDADTGEFTLGTDSGTATLETTAGTGAT